jgi:hypothetical protein
MHIRIVPHMLIIGWLALLTCLWTTGDMVVDLAFETPDVASDASATAEEPDNAAEHLLMPSRQADRLTAGTLTAAQTTDFDASSTAVTAPDNATLKAPPSHYPPPRSSPASFSVPLRI